MINDPRIEKRLLNFQNDGTKNSLIERTESRKMEIRKTKIREKLMKIRYDQFLFKKNNSLEINPSSLNIDEEFLVIFEKTDDKLSIIYDILKNNQSSLDYIKFAINYLRKIVIVSDENQLLDIDFKIVEINNIIQIFVNSNDDQIMYEAGWIIISATHTSSNIIDAICKNQENVWELIKILDQDKIEKIYSITFIILSNLLYIKDSQIIKNFDLFLIDKIQKFFKKNLSSETKLILFEILQNFILSTEDPHQYTIKQYENIFSEISKFFNDINSSSESYSLAINALNFLENITLKVDNLIFKKILDSRIIDNLLHLIISENSLDLKKDQIIYIKTFEFIKNFAQGPHNFINYDKFLDFLEILQNFYDSIEINDSNDVKENYLLLIKMLYNLSFEENNRKLISKSNLLSKIFDFHVKNINFIQFTEILLLHLKIMLDKDDAELIECTMLQFPLIEFVSSILNSNSTDNYLIELIPSALDLLLVVLSFDDGIYLIQSRALINKIGLYDSLTRMLEYNQTHIFSKAEILLKIISSE